MQRALSTIHGSVDPCLLDRDDLFVCVIFKHSFSSMQKMIDVYLSSADSMAAPLIALELPAIPIFCCSSCLIFSL